MTKAPANSPITTILNPAQLRHLECINQAWAKSLTGWRDSVEGIIATGKALTAAQSELQGDFDALLEEPQFPFGQRMVQMLRKIADHPVLSDETCFASLPPSWGSLHALSQLPDKVIKKALTDGRINPKMERKDVAKLKPPKKCAAAGCNRPVHKDGYCDQHYVAPTNPAPKELTGPQKKLLTLLNSDHGLLASLLEQFLPGVERFVGPVFDRSALRDELLAIMKQKRLFPAAPASTTARPVDDDDAATAAIFRAAADKYGDRPPPPKASGPVQEMSAESIVPENAPVFAEDADAAERSSGCPDDGDRRPKWMVEREVRLSRWHRG
jgi:hypothetical protein